MGGGTLFSCYLTLTLLTPTDAAKWVELLFAAGFALTCLATIVGLLTNKRYGIVLGYVVVVSIVLMFIGEAITHYNQVGRFNLEDIMWSTLFVATPMLILLGLRQLKPTKKPQHERCSNPDSRH